MKNILDNLINPLNYNSFKNLVIALAENKSSSGEITIEHIAATKINAYRIKRIEKQSIVSEDIKRSLQLLKTKWNWILITESWCGDGAQNVPIIAKIAECSPLIELKIILRDENTKIMDAYLTNGTRSVPKLICFNSENMVEVGIWGPRPMAIQRMVKEYKANNPYVPHHEFVENLHLWYAKNGGSALQEEFAQLLKEWVHL